MYDGIHYQDVEPTPLQKFAQRIFSICTNSASCERLFSLFSTVLTKLRSRLSLQSMTDLAELHLHLRDEYIQMGDKKGHLHCTRKIIPDPLPSPAIVPVDSIPNDPLSESAQPENQDEDASDDENSLGHIASVLAQRSFEDEDPTDDIPMFNDIPLQQLFNFKDESWVRLTEVFGMRSIDYEFEFYELVDMDMEGEDDEQTFDDMMSSMIQ
ncbi:hypothetical protein BDR07DRAFT_1302396 [Suillus spraguei]|nr:hypothetical protein BDR07DRAFT_1302396 [Suillus spraguei]